MSLTTLAAAHRGIPISIPRSHLPTLTPSFRPAAPCNLASRSLSPTTFNTHFSHHNPPYHCARHHTNIPDLAPPRRAANLPTDHSPTTPPRPTNHTSTCLAFRTADHTTSGHCQHHGTDGTPRHCPVPSFCSIHSTYHQHNNATSSFSFHHFSCKQATQCRPLRARRSHPGASLGQAPAPTFTH